MKMELQTIQNKIHIIRGLTVMLDRDLAEMYGVETRVLKQAVRRNIERFEGEDFMFELSVEETQGFSRSQFVTMNMGRGYNIKYKPEMQVANKENLYPRRKIGFIKEE